MSKVNLDPIFISAFDRAASKSYLSRFYPNGRNFVIASFSGIFFRIHKIFNGFLISFFPKIEIWCDNFIHKKEWKEITAEEIEKGFFDSSLLDEKAIPSDERMLHVLLRAKEIAKDMGIQQEIKLYSSNNCFVSHTMGCRYSLTSIPILLSLYDINGTDEELDFVIGHELGHIYHNHIAINALYNLAILVAEIVLSILFTPFLIPLIEGCAFAGKTFIHIKSEIEADLHSIRHFESNRGAISWWKRFFEGFEDDYDFLDETLLRVQAAHEE